MWVGTPVLIPVVSLSVDGCVRVVIGQSGGHWAVLSTDAEPGWFLEDQLVPPSPQAAHSRITSSLLILDGPSGRHLTCLVWGG